jgi:hypothetical protein
MVSRNIIRMGAIVQNGFHLLVGSPAVVSLHARRLLVRLAARQPVRWLMCDNYVDLQPLFYDVVQRAGRNYADILQKNIIISRAETCYQVVALLRKTEPAGIPTIVTNMLPRFYDEQVPEKEAAEILGDTILALKRLSQAGPVGVTAFSGNQRPELYTELVENAGRITRYQEKIMGHNTPSLTMRFRSERDYFAGFCRALLSKSERSLFDEMWNSAEKYIPEAEKSSHPLLIATILMAMLLEQKKNEIDLRCQIEMLKDELKKQGQTQSGELTQTKIAVELLEEEIEEKVKTLRSELIDMKFQY